jgi:hypothetical protein
LTERTWPFWRWRERRRSATWPLCTACSRKFVHRQADKASVALDEVFASTTPYDEVLFVLPVTKTWLRQLTLGLTLICHSSYRGVVELLRDLLGWVLSH